MVSNRLKEELVDLQKRGGTFIHQDDVRQLFPDKETANEKDFGKGDECAVLFDTLESSISDIKTEFLEKLVDEGFVDKEFKIGHNRESGEQRYIPVYTISKLGKEFLAQQNRKENPDQKQLPQRP